MFTNPTGATPEQVREYGAAVFNLLGGQDPLVLLRQTDRSLDLPVEGLTQAELASPEAAGKWSIIGVLQHLADSELVWAYRIRMVLAEDGPPAVGYDQDR